MYKTAEDFINCLENCFELYGKKFPNEIDGSVSNIELGELEINYLIDELEKAHELHALLKQARAAIVDPSDDYYEQLIEQIDGVLK